MTVYFVNIRDLRTGYLFEDMCATFDPADPYYGSDGAARTAAEECYTASLEDFPAAEYEVMFLALS